MTQLPDAISKGNHSRPEDGLCVMETVAFVAGEPHTDHPACACPVITKFAMQVNDLMPDDQTRTRLLGPLVWRIAGTRSTREVESRRAFRLADWAVREIAPLALRADGRIADATRLEGIAPVVDKISASSAASSAAAAAGYAAAAASSAYAASASYAAAYAAAAAAAASAAAYAAAAAGYAADAASSAAYAYAASIWELAARVIAELCDMDVTA